MNVGLMLKEQGQAAVAQANHDWGVLIRPVFRSWLDMLLARRTPEFCMEEFRAFCCAEDADPSWVPDSPNCWGAFATAMQKEGMIAVVMIGDTPKMRRAESPQTRSHYVRVYRAIPAVEVLQ